MPKVTITEKNFTSLPAPKDKGKIIYTDTHFKNFIIEVRPSGTSTAYFRYFHNNRLRFVNLGNPQFLDLKDTQKRILELAKHFEQGIMPDQVKAKTMTVEAYFNDHYLPSAKTRKRSWKTDYSHWTNWIAPKFGQYFIDKVDSADIQKFHNDLVAKHNLTKSTANRVLSGVKVLFSHAKANKLIKENPADGIKMFTVNNIVNVFMRTDDQKKMLEDARHVAGEDFAVFLYLLSVTGCRRGEMKTAKWADIDFAKGTWTLPITKSGKTHVLQLSDHLKAYLQTLPKISEYVAPNRKTGKPFTDFQRKWDKVRKNANRPDLRIHDLRHLFATRLVESGHHMIAISKVLGHHSVTVTQRYARASDDLQRSAMQTAASALL